MPIGIELAGGILVGTSKPVEAKYGPYSSTSAALSDIGITLRYKGLTVGIEDAGQIKEYWFRDGVTDSDFIQKNLGGGGGGGGSVTVSKVSTNGAYSGEITNVTGLRFDEDSGFDVVDLGSGNAKVQMNSTFKHWQVDGQPGLTAQGLDTVNFIAGTNIDIIANTTNKSLTFSTPNLNVGPGLTYGYDSVYNVNTLYLSTPMPTFTEGTGIDIGVNSVTNVVTVSAALANTTHDDVTLNDPIINRPSIEDPTIDMGGNSITGLGEPVNSSDAATKQYVNAQIAGISTSVFSYKGGITSVYPIDSSLTAASLDLDALSQTAGSYYSVNGDYQLTSAGAGYDTQGRGKVNLSWGAGSNSAVAVQGDALVKTPTGWDIIPVTQTNSVFGTIAIQNADAVAITGGNIQGTAIGTVTPGVGKFTSLESTLFLKSSEIETSFVYGLTNDIPVGSYAASTQWVTNELAKTNNHRGSLHQAAMSAGVTSVSPPLDLGFLVSAWGSYLPATPGQFFIVDTIFSTNGNPSQESLQVTWENNPWYNKLFLRIGDLLLRTQNGWVCLSNGGKKGASLRYSGTLTHETTSGGNLNYMLPDTTEGALYVCADLEAKNYYDMNAMFSITLSPGDGLFKGPTGWQKLVLSGGGGEIGGPISTSQITLTGSSPAVKITPNFGLGFLLKDELDSNILHLGMWYGRSGIVSHTPDMQLLTPSKLLIGGISGGFASTAEEVTIDSNVTKITGQLKTAWIEPSTPGTSILINSELLVGAGLIDLSMGMGYSRIYKGRISEVISYPGNSSPINLDNAYSQLSQTIGSYYEIDIDYLPPSPSSYNEGSVIFTYTDPITLYPKQITAKVGDGILRTATGWQVLLGPRQRVAFRGNISNVIIPGTIPSFPIDLSTYLMFDPPGTIYVIDSDYGVVGGIVPFSYMDLNTASTVTLNLEKGAVILKVDLAGWRKIGGSSGGGSGGSSGLNLKNMSSVFPPGMATPPFDLSYLDQATGTVYLVDYEYSGTPGVSVAATYYDYADSNAGVLKLIDFKKNDLLLKTPTGWIEILAPHDVKTQNIQSEGTSPNITKMVGDIRLVGSPGPFQDAYSVGSVLSHNGIYLNASGGDTYFKAEYGDIILGANYNPGGSVKVRGKIEGISSSSVPIPRLENFIIDGGEF